MPIVKSDIPDLLTAGLRAEFFSAYEKLGRESIIPRVTTVIQTTLPSQKYGWLGSVPTMREFTDERLPGGLKQYSYTIEDKVWEASIGIDRRALEDDQYDMIRQRTRDLALEAVRHQEQLVVDQLAKGAAQTCYDGQYLIDTDHAEGDSGTQSNKTTSALTQATLQDAISAMMQIKNDRGLPMRIIPDTLVVGPKLQWIATELLSSQVVVVNIGDGAAGSGATAATNYANPIQGKLRLIVSHYLTGAYDDYWFVLDTSRSMRGVILQSRSDVPVEFAALDNPNGSEEMFMRDRLLYGVRARYNVGYGLWQTVYGGIL